MEELLRAIREKTNLTKDLEVKILEKFKREKFSKSDLLLSEGGYCKKFYFLETGMVRSFYYDKGKDITSWIYRDGYFFTSWYSFYSKEPSFEYIEVLSHCEMYSISESSFNELADKFPEFSKFARGIAQDQLSTLDYYFKGYMNMTAKEKYLLLLSYFPDIELHMKLGHIASYLGISQETLSRIRADK